MKFNQRRQLAQVALFSLMALGADSAFAQAAGERPTDPRGGPCHCSDPVNVLIVKNSGPTSAVAGGDFRSDMRLNQQSYNATQPNTHFTDTLQWKMPTSKTCELKGQVTIKLKNLGTSLSSNDSAGVFANGIAVPGFSQGVGTVWSSGQGAGALKTLTYQLNTQMMQLGKLSFFAQDDTAVQEIRVEISGCCINPTR